MPEIREEVTVGEVGNSLRIVIPKTIAKPLGITKGEVLIMQTTDHDEILLRRQKIPRKR